jgi:hypothetical protein
MSSPINKHFKIPGDKIQKLISNKGSCIATDAITVDGLQVGYMYREEPDDNIDSGWRFFSGTEDQDYVDNPSNMALYDINTIANYDPEIISHLDLPIGTALERDANGSFVIIEE